MPRYSQKGVKGGGGTVKDGKDKSAEKQRRRGPKGVSEGEYAGNPSTSHVQSEAAKFANTYRGLDEAINNKGIKLSEGERIFPAHYLQVSEGEKNLQDRVTSARMMAEAVQTAGGNGPVVNVSPDESMLKYIRQKDEMLWWQNFERYLEQEYVVSGELDKRDFIRKVYPQYFQMREEFIDSRIDIDRRVAKLKLNGPRDLEDVQLEYLINTRQIELPTTPVWDTNMTQAQLQSAYQRGLLNYRKTFSLPEKAGTQVAYTPGGNGAWGMNGGQVGVGGTSLWTGPIAGPRMSAVQNSNPFRSNMRVGMGQRNM